MKKQTKKRAEKQELILNRISRIDGQIKGIRRMIEEEKECLDVITQITAIRAAVSMLGMEILKNDFLCKRQENKKIDEAYLKTLFKIN